jgi:uncharacterized protein (DUF1499 family)
MVSQSLTNSLQPVLQPVLRVIRAIPVFLASLVVSFSCWLGGTPSASALPVRTALPPISALRPPSFLASLFHFSGTRPTALGVRDGKLLPCPATPNCVNSQTSESIHRIAPISPGSNPAASFSQLKSIVEGMSAAQIIKAEDRYLYAEFTSPWMGYVDDVEFYLDPDGAIQVRSASRLGESDLGVNRKRIEAIREKLAG